MLKIVFFSLSLFSVVSSITLKGIKRSFSCIGLASTLLSLPLIVNAEEIENTTVSVVEKTSLTFSEWVTAMDSGKISKVTFKGINPEYLMAEMKETKSQIKVEDGFPAYNDPRTASGPQQAIAKCQHTPGVVCVQDISDILSKSKTRDVNQMKEPAPMLTHSNYPKAF